MTINHTDGWHWELNDGDHHVCLELYDADKNLLAHISERPGYCDRGHFLVLLESRDLNLDEADGRSLMYYMDLEVAMWETVEFLLWRMHKVSYQHAKGGIRAWAKENMPAGRLDVTSVEFRSTKAPLTVDAVRAGMAIIGVKLTPQQLLRREHIFDKLKQPFIGYFRVNHTADDAKPYRRFVHKDGRDSLDITDDEAAELQLESAIEEAVNGIIERAAGSCCARDTDGDGNCPIHKSPGEFRTGGGR